MLHLWASLTEKFLSPFRGFGFVLGEPELYLKERYREKIEKMRNRLECYNIILLRQYKRDNPPNSTKELLGF